MNEPTQHHEDDLAGASREEIMAAMFANMVIQQANMAMMLLGKMPHPETGEHVLDVDAARMFIDQLEMLEVKTKGNLSKQEEGLLKQALAALHMTFVEAIEKPAPGAPAPQPAAPAPAPSPAPAPAPSAQSAPAAAAREPVTSPAPPTDAQAAPDESRKKFSKKY